jgi:hypothetical protein
MARRREAASQALSPLTSLPGRVATTHTARNGTAAGAEQGPAASTRRGPSRSLQPRPADPPSPPQTAGRAAATRHAPYP